MILNIQYYHQDDNFHFYVFENGDGTKYTLHLTQAYYGGIYVICNESSVWRFHNNPNELKHLCGDNNKYTELAILQLANYAGWTE
tara:strand:- start:180 stop:434 length:255 start_codon:yes stop_codon:yes gene_type:complete